MAFLKQWLFLGLFFPFTVSFAQETQTDKVINAFSESYTLEQKGDYSGAANKIKTVYNEDSYEINLRLGWLDYMAGSFSESIAFYQKAITLMPYSEEAKFGLIYPKYALGKFDEVIGIYKQILENSPNNTTALYKLGYLYYGRAQYDLALPLFKKMVDLYPFGHDGLLMYAWTNYQLKKYKDAKILFQKVLMNTPTDSSAKEGIGLCK